MPGLGFELVSLERQDVLEAEFKVHLNGTSNIPWCLYPADASVFFGDLNVRVYGFGVTSTLTSPEDNFKICSALEIATFGVGSTSGKRRVAGEAFGYFYTVPYTSVS